MQYSRWYIFLFTILFLTACEQQTPSGQQQRPLIVGTTGMIGDALRQIAGESAEVGHLMGPGVDPHLFKANPGDLALLRKADLIVYNGLHLEGKMGDILEKMAEQKPVLALGETLPDSLLIAHETYENAYDSHIWFDVDLWRQANAALADYLLDWRPTLADTFRYRSARWQEQLEKLHEEVRFDIRQIPDSSRVLITAHDAFRYFGKAYGISVRGLQGISTVSEFGLKDRIDMTDFIVDRGIKAVFVESSVPEKYLQSVVEGCASKGHEVQIGGTLYSDAMGKPGGPADTYLKMVRYNVRTIVDALK